MTDTTTVDETPRVRRRSSPELVESERPRAPTAPPRTRRSRPACCSRSSCRCCRSRSSRCSCSTSRGCSSPATRTPRSSIGIVITLAILVGASLIAAAPAPAHVVAGDDPRLACSSSCRWPACVVARPEPRRGRGRRRRLRRADRPGRSGTVDGRGARVDQVQRRPTYTAPGRHRASSTTAAPPATRSPSRTRSSTASCSPPTPAARRRARSSCSRASTRSTAPSRATRPQGMKATLTVSMSRRDAWRAVAGARSLAAVADRRASPRAVAVADDGGGKAYVEPKGPADRDASRSRRATSTSSPTRSRPNAGHRRRSSSTADERDPRPRVRRRRTRASSSRPTAAAARDVEEDRPEAREVHLLLQHHRPPRRRAWKARSPSSSRSAGTTTAQRARHRLEPRRAAGPACSPLAHSSSGVGGVERLDGRPRVPRRVVHLRVLDVRAAEHRRERAQEVGARHRADDAHVEQAVVRRWPSGVIIIPLA